ncbi:hypothetical protein PspLS_01733 [Pyricularia sp. CBS 133598]|nr:hypothetical protein PspLS_01733 [Pyricularia sp. CBS 133598]
MRSPSQESSDLDMRATEVQINKPLRHALPTSLENVNNAPLFTSPRRSIDDRLRKHENQPKRKGAGALTGSPPCSGTHSPHESIRYSSQHEPRFRSQHQSHGRSSSQAPLQTTTIQTPRSQLPRSASTAKNHATPDAASNATGGSMRQSRTPKNSVKTGESSGHGSSRIPRPSVSNPQTPRTDSLEHVNVRKGDHTTDSVQPNNSTSTPARQIRPSNAARDVIVKAIAVAESDIARYKGLDGIFSKEVERLTNQIIKDFEHAGLATIQTAATDASVNNQTLINHDVCEELRHYVQGALSHHEDRMIKRLESHHLGMRNHESKVGNEIKSLINNQTTKITSVIQELGRAFRSQTLNQRSEVTPPNTRITGFSGRKRPRTSSPSIMVEDTNN